MNTKKGLNCYIFSNLIVTFLSLNFLINVPLSTNIANQNDSYVLSKAYETEVLANSNLNMGYKTQTTNTPSTTTISVSRVNVNSQNYISYIKPSYNSVTGASLVEYAKHYLGLRYVHGGNSLTTGTDCSGFTQLIFREFEIYLGRTVSSQMYSGKYVSKSDLQPGDLVFYGYSSNYASHVGIYMGNGLVIHQSNPRDGVKINTVNMMVYVTARRLITSNVVINDNSKDTNTNLDNTNNSGELQENVDKKQEDKNVESKDTSSNSSSVVPEDTKPLVPDEKTPEETIPSDSQPLPDVTTSQPSGQEENNDEQTNKESKEEIIPPTDDSINNEETSGNDMVSNLDS